MARLPRLVVPGQAHHVIQRGTNRQPVFRAREDFEAMLALLAAASQAAEVTIHAYVLMHNHFHLLATPAGPTSLSTVMQMVGRSYVRSYNDRYDRTGALWEGRFKAIPIDSERYLFTCMAYIELNPVRAGIVVAPADYPWSSYAHNAGIARNVLVREHPLYWALGNTPFAREAAYRDLVESGIRPTDQIAITSSTLKGWVLGSEAAVFDGHVPTRRGSPLKPGRPKKIYSDPN